MAGMKDEHRVNRRDFLGRAGLTAATAVAVGTAARGAKAAAKQADLLPMIKIGNYDVTRLVTGYNPIGGYSHATPNASRHMREYFTVERTVEFLQHCEAQGINAFQFDLSDKTREALPRLYDSGSKLQFICLHAKRRHDARLKEVMAYKPIAVVHHGGVTDAAFRAGKADEVHDFVKAVHDAGALAGVSSHNPDNIRRIADEGWEADLFMACFQNISRTKEEMAEELGFVTVGEPFIEEDRDKMTAAIREVEQPCLGFKILAAGRRCSSKRAVGRAFSYAFDNMKKTDGVIVGMFPVYQDEVAQNAAHVRKYGKL
ncbi:MAG: hypothetical protein GWP08_06875 [Nitrospiraceae bacterium]|nr:hypothetical protein [Nitrospiraceae bacterium]